MQQTCSNCRYPIQSGNAVCTNCGTPVSAGGGGYDPAAQYSAQYGAGAPQYGAPSPQYSQPAPNQFGAPQAPIFTPVSTPPRSRRGPLFLAIGIIAAVIIVIAVVVGAFGKFKQTVTTGTHVTKIQVGTGLDQTTFAIQGETATFHTGDTVYVSFVVETQDDNAQVILKLYAGTTLEDSTSPTSADKGTTTFGNSAVVKNTGTHKFEVDYNGTAEASITFNVT